MALIEIIEVQILFQKLPRYAPFVAYLIVLHTRKMQKVNYLKKAYSVI